jgi:hypothetical protein
MAKHWAVQECRLFFVLLQLFDKRQLCRASSEKTRFKYATLALSRTVQQARRQRLIGRTTAALAHGICFVR